MSTPTEERAALAVRIAERLQDEFTIGTSTCFCDEVDWDGTETEELAIIILEELKK